MTSMEELEEKSNMASPPKLPTELIDQILEELVALCEPDEEAPEHDQSSFLWACKSTSHRGVRQLVLFQEGSSSHMGQD